MFSVILPYILKVYMKKQGLWLLRNKYTEPVFEEIILFREEASQYITDNLNNINYSISFYNMIVKTRAENKLAWFKN